MNSRRLRHLPRFTPEEEAFCSAEEYSAYATASEAVAQDICDYAHVDLDDADDCVLRFAKQRQDAGDMYVCALCGLRDPEVEYTQYDLQDAIDARTRDDDSQPVRPWLQVRSTAMVTGSSQTSLFIRTHLCLCHIHNIDVHTLAKCKRVHGSV